MLLSLKHLMVGAAGFEPATSCSRSRRATGLRYAPPTNLTAHAPGGTRIPNLLIRSQMLYPIELRARNKTAANNRSDRSKTDTDYRPHPPDRQPVHLASSTPREGCRALSPVRSPPAGGATNWLMRIRLDGILPTRKTKPPARGRG